jgi:V/A-type H+-transporting ATPase subunit F
VKRVIFITEPAARFGFSLAGLNQYVAEPQELEDVLGKAVSDPENGLIVIDEHLTAGIGEERMKEIEAAWHGVIVVLPSPLAGPGEIEDYAARLIRRAVGYHVRIRL